MLRVGESRIKCRGRSLWKVPKGSIIARRFGGRFEKVLLAGWRCHALNAQLKSSESEESVKVKFVSLDF